MILNFGFKLFTSPLYVYIYRLVQASSTKLYTATLIIYSDKLHSNRKHALCCFENINMPKFLYSVFDLGKLCQCEMGHEDTGGNHSQQTPCPLPHYHHRLHLHGSRLVDSVNCSLGKLSKVHNCPRCTR